MNSTLKLLTAVVLAITVIGSGVTIFHYDYSGKNKGVIINVNTGYNGTKPLTRIVSLDPSATATIYALGAFSSLVGGTVYDSYPPGEHLPNVTDFPSMDLEEIFNLTPQAVIAFSNYNSSQISALLNAGIDYIFLGSDSGSNFSTIEKQNTLLGEITGHQGNASKINAWMNQSLSAISATAKSASTNGEISGFYYLSSYGGIYTAGNNTFVNQFFQYAHVRNIAAPFDSGFYTISSAEVLNASPQLLLLDPYVNMSTLNAPPFNTSSAVRDNMTFTVNDNLFSEANFRDVYAVQWVLYKAYNVTASIPQFPIALKYSPDPLTLG